METTYWYPQVSGGYRWNMLQRCVYQVGLEPINTGDANGQTYLTFSRALTTTEKANLDALMADNPTFPPSTGVGLIIKDIYENWASFKADTQLPNLQLFYSQSTSGGAVDQIYLWNPTALTTAQKNRVKTAYSNLFVTV